MAKKVHSNIIASRKERSAPEKRNHIQNRRPNIKSIINYPASQSINSPSNHYYQIIHPPSETMWNQSINPPVNYLANQSKSLIETIYHVLFLYIQNGEHNQQKYNKLTTTKIKFKKLQKLQFCCANPYIELRLVYLIVSIGNLARVSY